MEDKLEQYKKRDLYPVPDGYFDTLSGKVMSRLSAETAVSEDESIVANRTESDFSVPEGYFASLSSRVMQQVAGAKSAKEELSFSDAEKDFPVPEGYFTALPDKVMQRIAAESSRRLVLRCRLVRIASAAASIILLFGVSAYIVTSLQDVATKTASPTTARVVSKKAAKKAQSAEPTIHMADALAQMSDATAAPKTARKYESAVIATDPRTDKFIDDNLAEEELDDVDYEILDYYSDDMATSDMWAW